MSSFSSLAQLLPLHIIESIIDYTGSVHVYTNKFDQQAALAFLNSCQSWRSVFLRKIHSHIFFQTDVPTAPKFVFCPWSDASISLTHATRQAVRCLIMCLSRWDRIMDGSLLTCMRQTGVFNVVFSSTTKLIIRVDDYNNFSDISKKKIPAAIKNIKEFLHQVRSMVPNLKSAEIIWYNVKFASVGQNFDSFIFDCIIYIIRDLRSSGFSEYGTPNRPTKLVPEYFSGLTLFECNRGYNPIWFSELVRYNAGTLESLKTSDLHKNHFQTLLQNSNSEPVIYPFLKFLKLEKFHTANREAAVTSAFSGNVGTNINHFPILESFFISGRFPYADNVFVSGNNAILKNLSIVIYDGSLLQRTSVYQKYGSTRFYNLISISVSSDNLMTRSGVHIFTHQIEFLQSCLSCSTNVAKFTYSGNMDKQRFYQEAKSTSIFQSLQFLDIQHTIISFSDIIILLQKIPFLQHLKCSIDNKTPTIKGIGPSKLPGYISSIHPLNKQLKSIKLKAQARSPIKYISKTAILLAIGCPRLFKLCTSVDRNEYRKEIDNISKTKWFSDYAEQCQFISSRICYE